MKTNFILILVVFLYLFSDIITAQTYFQKVFQSSPFDEEGQDVLPTADGGYLITGYTTNNTINDCDILVIKADALGNELWRKTYGGAKPDFPYHMLATADGNFFLAGYSYSYGGGDMDILLMKIDPAGTLLWTKTYGGNGNDMGRDIIQTADGNYMIIGSSNSPGLGDQNANLIKIDPSGTILWSKLYGGTSNDYGNCVKQTSDGGYIMIGQTFSFGSPGGDAYLVKLNSNGDTTWTKQFGGTLNDEGYYITVATDGGYVFLVRDSSNVGQDIDIRMIKTDANGTIVWNKVYGGNKKDTPKMVQNTSDGGYIIGAISRSFGWINPDMWILKCNSMGDTTWTRHYGGSQNEHCYVVREILDGSYIAIGKTASYSPNFDPIFLKLSPNGSITVGMKELDMVSENVQLYPNPSEGNIYVESKGYEINKVRITNLLGEQVYSKELNKDEPIDIEIPDKRSGVYILTCETGSHSITKKFIVN